MKRIGVLAFVFALILNLQAADAAAGVTIYERGNGNPYGWRGYDMAIGCSVLGWSLPNEECNIYGIRFNLGWGEYANTYGLDFGTFSNTRNDAGGIQINFFGNVTGADASGLQIGAVNIARGNAYGLQIGFVNFAENLHGVQIGALNFNYAGICLPIINAGF